MAGTLRYSLSIDARLLSELNEVLRDIRCEAVSLSISILYSLTVRDSAVGDTFSFWLWPDSFAGKAFSSLCTDREEFLVAVESREVMTCRGRGGWSAGFGGDILGRRCLLCSLFFDGDCSFLDGEVGREEVSQDLRENILKALALFVCDFVVGGSFFTRDRPVLSTLSVSEDGVNRDTDIRFLVF